MMQRVKIYSAYDFIAEDCFPHRPMIGDELTIRLTVYKVIATRWESNAIRLDKVDDHWKILVEEHDILDWPNVANQI